MAVDYGLEAMGAGVGIGVVLGALFFTLSRVMSVSINGLERIDIDRSS